MRYNLVMEPWNTVVHILCKHLSHYCASGPAFCFSHKQQGMQYAYKRTSGCKLYIMDRVLGPKLSYVPFNCRGSEHFNDLKPMSERSYVQERDCSILQNLFDILSFFEQSRCQQLKQLRFLEFNNNSGGKLKTRIQKIDYSKPSITSCDHKPPLKYVLFNRLAASAIKWKIQKRSLERLSFPCKE